MRRKGFTLIELLVVIAIIAILAAILFPVFMNAREKGRQTSCLNNMGQLTKAVMLYLDDNGRYPTSGDLTNESVPGWIGYKGHWTDNDGGFHYYNPPPPWHWMVMPSKGSIWKYTNRSAKLFVCPSDKHATYKTWTDYGGFGLSYDINHNIFISAYGDTAPNSGIWDNAKNTWKVIYPAMESDIVRPAKTVLFADHGDGSRTSIKVFLDGFARDPACSIYNNHTPCFDGVFRWWQEAPTPVHCGGQNWSFCDGHVKWKNLKQWHDLVFYRDGTPPKYFTNNQMSE
jgi:prepilin-type N-terminal cleavage/methylation domain-containing protein/prepilin-type processing-associated H-X9-DG protein